MFSPASNNKYARLASYATVVAFVLALFVFWIWLDDRYTWLRVQYLRDTFAFYRPTWVDIELQRGRILGVIAAAVIIAINHLVVAAAACSAAFFATKILWDRLRKEAIEPVKAEATAYMKRPSSTSEIVIIPPQPSRDPSAPAPMPVEPQYPEFAEFYLHSRRQDLAVDTTGLSAHAQLEVAILEMMAAYDGLPAATGVHHGDETLLGHSRRIADAMALHAAKAGLDANLARVIGISHDLNKLFVYREAGEQWKSSCTHHNHISGRLLAQIPEFTLLEPSDAQICLLTLRYCHRPKDFKLLSTEGSQISPYVPTQQTLHTTWEYIELLRLADSIGTVTERVESGTRAMESFDTSTLKSPLIEAIESMNINLCKDLAAPNEGWTLEILPFVAISERQLRSALKTRVQRKESEALQLELESRPQIPHPGRLAIRNTLRELDLLLTCYKSADSDSGIFDIKVGDIRWKGVFLISKHRLAELLGGDAVIKDWSDCQYKIRVLKGLTLPEDAPDQGAEPAEAAASESPAGEQRAEPAVAP